MYIAHILADDTAGSFGGGGESLLVECCTDKDAFNVTSTYRGARDTKVGDLSRHTPVIECRRQDSGSSHQGIVTGAAGKLHKCPASLRGKPGEVHLYDHLTWFQAGG